MNHQTNLNRKTFNVGKQNYNKPKPGCKIELIPNGKKNKSKSK